MKRKTGVCGARTIGSTKIVDGNKPPSEKIAEAEAKLEAKALTDLVNKFNEFNPKLLEVHNYINNLYSKLGSSYSRDDNKPSVEQRLYSLENVQSEPENWKFVFVFFYKAVVVSALIVCLFAFKIKLDDVEKNISKLTTPVIKEELKTDPAIGIMNARLDKMECVLGAAAKSSCENLQIPYNLFIKKQKN
jgi:hypothetical protein